MKYLLLLVLSVVFLYGKMYRDQREVVIDDESKLMWMDDTSVIKVLKTHAEATEYCDNIKYVGYNNWRLPSIEEFQTIVDKENTKTYMNRVFKYNVPDGYWADKAHWRTLWFYADYMYFVSGTPYYDSRHKKKYVRCVRDYK